MNNLSQIIQNREQRKHLDIKCHSLNSSHKSAMAKTITQSNGSLSHLEWATKQLGLIPIQAAETSLKFRLLDWLARK